MCEFPSFARFAVIVVYFLYTRYRFKNLVSIENVRSEPEAGFRVILKRSANQN